MADGLTLGIIGVGNLGGALAEGALASGAVSRVVAADISDQRLGELAASIGDGFSSADSAETASKSDLLVVAVKPHVVPAVLRDVREALPAGCVLVSVAAGVPITRLANGLLPRWPIVRVMPNLAMLVRESASALCANRRVTPEQLEVVESVFRSVGTVTRVEERQMHAVTGLTGSGPAFVSLLVEGLAAGGVLKGLHPDLARTMACQLLLGTASLLREKGWHPAELSERVTTPAGTTIAGLRELEVRAVRGALISAVEAASDRSAELAES